jgi:hypothetical protein
MNWAKAFEQYRHLCAGRAVTSQRVFHTWQRLVLRQSSIGVAATYKHSMCLSVRECLLSFGAESVVFQVAIQKLKDQDI